MVPITTLRVVPIQRYRHMKMVMMTVAANMIVLMKTIMIVVIAIVMSMKAARMMSTMTIIAVGSHLMKMDYSHYYIILYYTALN